MRPLNLIVTTLSALALGMPLFSFAQTAAQVAAGPAAAAKKCPCTSNTCTAFVSNNKPPISLTGTLAVKHTLDANSRPYAPYVLVLAKPLCIAADTSIPDAPEARPVGPLRVLQLTFDDNARNKAYLAGLMNKPVTADGRLFAAFTGWHITPAILNVTHLQSAVK